MSRVALTHRGMDRQDTEKIRCPVYGSTTGKGVSMAFSKKGISHSPIKIVPQVGDKKDGNVWDGEKWISEAEWEARQKASK